MEFSKNMYRYVWSIYGFIEPSFFLLQQDSQAMQSLPHRVFTDVHGVSLARQNHLGLHSDAGGGDMRGNSGF